MLMSGETMRLKIFVNDLIDQRSILTFACFVFEDKSTVN